MTCSPVTVACRDNPMRHLRACGLFLVVSASVIVPPCSCEQRGSPSERRQCHRIDVSGLADAVLGVVQGVGLSSDTVARYGKCCEAVVEFCSRRGLDALSGSVVEDFVA